MILDMRQQPATASRANSCNGTPATAGKVHVNNAGAEHSLQRILRDTLVQVANEGLLRIVRAARAHSGNGARHSPGQAITASHAHSENQGVAAGFRQGHQQINARKHHKLRQQQATARTRSCCDEKMPSNAHAGLLDWERWKCEKNRGWQESPAFWPYYVPSL